MKSILTVLIALVSFSTHAQTMSIEEWDNEAKTNKRLLPKYGMGPKDAVEKNADIAFIALALKSDSTHRKASDHLVRLGFNYIYKDIKTAMYRFNQAYLLDSTNTDVYWGFGGIYMVLGDFERAKAQYIQGLSINPENTHLLTDYGTYFMAQLSDPRAISEADFKSHLNSAITYLTKSYNIDPKDQNTSFKLSVCYFQKKDCDSALKYYNICKALGGQPIGDDYTDALRKSCKL